MSHQNSGQLHETSDLAESRHRSTCEGPPRKGGLIARFTDIFKPTYDGPPLWLWYTGVARIILLMVVVFGMHQVVSPILGISILTAIFIAAMGCSLWYLLSLRRSSKVTTPITWTQMLVDFSVVASIVSFTGGASSFFTFLFVIVILEAGTLMGLVQGFVFASLSALFILAQLFDSSLPSAAGLPHWYVYLIQCIAFFSTAIISGYWNQRISRLKQFQREILDNMVNGFLICNPKGRVVAVNSAACIILQMDEEELIDQNVEDVLVCVSGAECPVATALRNARDFVSYEFMVRTGHNEDKLLGLTTNRLYDHRDQLMALIASFTDLTEVAQMRLALQQQDRWAAVGEAATMLTHEIRNPLTSLRVAVEALRTCGDSVEDTRNLQSIILRESDHLNHIVTAFLDFAHNKEFNREPVDVGALSEEMVHEVRQITPDIHVNVRYNEGPHLIKGEPTKIRQLFDNIIRNSIEAMEGQGDLTLSLRAFGKYIEIVFDDTGPGIAPDKVARVFEPFYTEKQKGIGMGLPVCLRIVTAHDGNIQVSARPGGGTSMIVRLPRVNG